MKIVLPDQLDLTPAARQFFTEHKAEMFHDIPDTPTVIERIHDAEIITANYIDITAEIIDASDKLRYIVIPAVGYDWVDSGAATARGIIMVNCPTHNSHAVAEHAFALIFSSWKNIVQQQQLLASGTWAPTGFLGRELFSKTLGVIGTGKIGSDIRTMAHALGMNVLSVNSRSTQPEWDTLYTHSDIICTCIPLNTSTAHLINKESFEAMKTNCLFINVGRGGTVDTHALIHALQSGKISGAGLDVYENEPLTGYPPESIIELANMDNVVATPHSAWYTHESVERLSSEIVQVVQSCLDDIPINIVNNIP